MQIGNGRGVQQAEVSAAADALLAQGQRPTVERVRRQLGRGSPNTVGPMLETWFAALAPRLGVSTVEPNSTGEAPTEVRQAMGALWLMALDLARKDVQTALATEHDQLQAQRNQLNDERTALAMTTAAATERETLRNSALERAESQADDLGLQLRAAQVTLQRREDELASVRVSLARAIEAKDAALHEHRVATQAADAGRRQQEERFATTERRYLEEIDRSRQDVKTLQKQLSDAEGRTAAHRKTWDADRKAAAAQIQILQTESAALRASLAASEKRIRDLRQLAAASHPLSSVKRQRRAS